MTDLSDILSLFPNAPVVSIAGAGGKTTLVFKLAEMIPGPCVVTTTTKVGETQILPADQRFTIDMFPPDKAGKIMWVSPSMIPSSGKITGFDPDGFASLVQICKEHKWALIYEADGAACRHIKAPAEHEPVIMPGTDVCFYLAGLDTLGEPMNAENVHRPELFAKITGVPPESMITKEMILSLLGSKNGGLKNIPDTALKIIYLTHSDTRERIEAAEFITKNQIWYDVVCINQ